MNVNLFFLVEGFKFGGFFSYTEHLYRSLIKEGHCPFIFKISKKTELSQREFCQGIPYQNVDIETANALSATDRSLITCMYWKGRNPTIAKTLFRNGCRLVIHDPTEVTPESIQSIKDYSVPVVVIRKSNELNLMALGVQPKFIPHPYCEVECKSADKVGSVSISRIDYDKHTEMIAEANMNLAVDKRIKIFGEVGRLYEFHKLKKLFPNWRNDYCGTFPKGHGSAVRLAQVFDFVVDMSAIKSDGGGTQYTFLEAWNAGCALVVNRKWLIPGGVLREGVNCYAAGTVEELVNVLQNNPDVEIVNCGKKVLSSHSSKIIIPQYEKILK